MPEVILGRLLEVSRGDKALGLLNEAELLEGDLEAVKLMRRRAWVDVR